MRDSAILGIARLASHLPLPLVRKLGALVGRRLYRENHREARIARVNLQMCLPELSDDEREALLRESLEQGGMTLLETPLIWRRHPDYWVKQVHRGEGHELVEQALARGKGVIAAGPHLGNWEVGLHYLNSLAEVTALYRAPRFAGLEGLMTRGRGRAGARMVAAGPQGVRALLGALRKGQMVGALCDQMPKQAGEQAGVFAPFFGHNAFSMVLVSRLARRTGATVLFWYMERLPGSQGYRMHWFPAPENIDAESPREAASAMNRALEACIRCKPEQYLWTYKRFAMVPPGEQAPYHVAFGVEPADLTGNHEKV